mmetsp:Transcript_83485/g.194108  ORF Transcript_83485/g.194108 Transcript_83485/m.194108 type:complete len:133 (-) Transcript_83485:184-582(-)|eukprot:CAMPEP_0171085252 /NCGR_PEP_ID=MMETSP0766_2-20121228/18826_1 /TAXON_ID=439317 /ORGANISM="Gambierdiscus australes, Strain CAWD 149" /LENGTH=132 /DNA_ID=CAMNT_0011542811 /DNA_START=55 /DNA_END=453 /DNA_ORIENTATION=-
MVRCLICGDTSVKYRFPCCRERYCSLPCYRAHAAGPCWARDRDEAPAKRRRAEQEQPEEEEEEEVLTEVRLCALRGHQGVRSALRSERFCGLLRRLDAAEDRRSALEELLEKDSFFVGFAEQLMEAIDYSRD